MLPVITTAEMRALDRATTDEVGIPGFTLMETAGRGVADAAVAMLVAHDKLSETVHGRPGSIAVVCGPGNNGGDGFVLARVLRSRNLDAIVYLAADRAALKGDALAHLLVLERSGGVILSIATPQELDRHRDMIATATLAIDALFGIGVTRPIEGHFAQVIDAINRAPLRLAVDIPSGLDTDTGETHGIAVDAQRTPTMAALKIGLVSAPGFAKCGELSIVDIGVPPGLLAASTLHAGLVERADVVHWLPRTTAMDHKGRRGHVLVVGGKPEMRGAGQLAAMAALRTGAGLVTLTTDTAPDDRAIDAPANSVMTKLVTTPAELGAALEGKAAVVIGPGLGTSEHARGLLEIVLHAGVPAVLDADALNLLVTTPGTQAQPRRGGSERAAAQFITSTQPVRSPHPAPPEASGAGATGAGATGAGATGAGATGPGATGSGATGSDAAAASSQPPHRQMTGAARLAAAAGPIAITPHPAEAARLLGITTAEVEADRLAAARRLASITRAVVVLKGARTVICDGTLGDDFCSINPTGGPALGTAGSGDVLTGALAALLAQGCTPVDAARVAVYVHGLAGEELGESLGDRGVISSDLPEAIAKAVRDLTG